VSVYFIYSLFNNAVINSVIILSNVCATIDEVGLVIGFIDYLQVVNTNNYDTIAISTPYSSLEHMN
jgi:hypothetical protein